MKVRSVKRSEVKVNPNNPRIIKDNKFKKLIKSVEDLPQMLEMRPIIVDEDMVILGGNMRYQACVRAGVQGVGKGQKEAAASIGLTPNQVLKLVVMPQALRIY